ncbi:class I SAM-dependent methyltransferase [Streptomyces sp. NPDC046977]|uniref:class I SAM-dependent methyltransferase n=1 Tax=Streptomyces sp. NPDC046977 TaxID=3154703 RepID=UPI0033C28928
MTAAAYAITSTQWDHWHRTGQAASRPVTDTEADQFLQHTRRPAPRATALDIGCGTGAFTRRLHRWGYNVTGLDFSPAAIDIATGAGTSRGLQYAVHDFDVDPIPARLAPGSLDLIVCRNSLPFLDYQRLLVDARRWLRPDGQLYVVVRVWPEHGAEPTGAPWQRGFTEDQVHDLQTGWADQRRYWLGRHTAVVLSGEPRHPLAVCPR